MLVGNPHASNVALIKGENKIIIKGQNNQGSATRQMKMYNDSTLNPEELEKYASPLILKQYASFHRIMYLLVNMFIKIHCIYNLIQIIL